MSDTQVPAVDVLTVARIGQDEAMAITAEHRRFADQLRSLDKDAWSRPADCPLWDVKGVAAHVVGSAAARASPPRSAGNRCATCSTSALPAMCGRTGSISLSSLPGHPASGPAIRRPWWSPRRNLCPS